MIDPQVKALTTAIRRTETGSVADPYNAKGASGEFGAYQFMPDTYRNYAKKYLGDENASPTVENQNKIAYSFVKEKKDAGFTPAQIASMWNAGESRPNAYKEGFRGTNKLGVAYDVPTYVQKVSQNYKELASQLVPTAQASTGMVEEKKPAIGASPVGLGKALGQALGGGKAIQQTSEGIDKILVAQRELLSRRNKAANEGRDTSKLDTALAQTNQTLRELGASADDIATGGIRTKDVVGAALGTASYLPVGFGASKIAGAIGTGGVRSVIGGVASGAVAGAGAGALQGAGDALTRDESVVGGAIKGGLVGGAIGGVIGGAVPIVAGATSALGRAVKGNVAPQFDDVAQQYADTILDTGKRNAKLTDNFIKANGVKPQDEIVRRGIVPVIEDGKVVFDDAIASVEREVDQFDEVIDKAVQRYDRLRVDEKQIVDQIESVLKKDPALATSGKVGSTRKLAQEIFDGYKEDFGRSTFTIPEIQSFKKAQYKLANRFKVGAVPDYTKADGHTIVAKAFKEIIENNVDDIAIKELNREYGRAISLMEYLAKVNGTAVKGGRLGKYFARSVGAVAGSGGGVIGTLVGATAGDAFASALQRYAVLGPLKARYVAQVGQGFKNEVLEQTIKYLDDVEKGLAPAVPKAVREQIIADLMAMPKMLPAPRAGAPRVELGSTGTVFVSPGGTASRSLQEATDASASQIGVAKQPGTQTVLPTVPPSRRLNERNTIIPPYKPNPATLPSSTIAKEAKVTPTPNDTALLREAKKYKSAEEFVKSKGQSFYHGTSGDFDVFDKTKLGSYTGAKDAELGFHFTDSKEIADLFGVPSKTKEVKLVTSKTLNFEDIINEDPKTIKNMFEIITGEKAPPIGSDEFDELVSNMNTDMGFNVRDFKREISEKKVMDRLIKKYDSIKLPLAESDQLMALNAGKNNRGYEYIVFNSDQIKTKSQLEKIWEEANKK